MAIYAIYASLRIIVDMSAVSVHGENISFDKAGLWNFVRQQLKTYVIQEDEYIRLYLNDSRRSINISNSEPGFITLNSGAKVIAFTVREESKEDDGFNLLYHVKVHHSDETSETQQTLQLKEALHKIDNLELLYGPVNIDCIIDKTECESEHNEENEGDRGNENTSQSTSQSALTSSESEGDSTSDNNENDDPLLKTESKRRPSHSSVKL